MVRWRPEQEASLAPPCSNLRPFRSKFTVLKKVLVTLLGLFGAHRSHFPPPQWFGAPWWFGNRGILPPCPLVTPLCLRPGVRSRTTSNFGWLEEEPERNIFRSEVLEHFQSHQSHPLCRWSLILVPLNPKNNGRNYLHMCVWTGINTFVTHCAMSFSSVYRPFAFNTHFSLHYFASICSFACLGGWRAIGFPSGEF